MGKDMSKDKFLGALIAMGIIAMVAYMIFSEMRKTKEQPVPAVEKEVVKISEAPAAPGYAIPRNIFPTEEEAKAGMENQLAKRQALDKALVERKETAVDVRKNVEASLNSAQAAPAIEEAKAANAPQQALGQSSVAVTTTFAAKQASDKLRKLRIGQFKNKQLFIHH